MALPKKDFFAQTWVRFIARQFARLLLLIVGAGLVWSVSRVYIRLDRAVPFYIALFGTYLAAAYLLIPTSIRLLRLVFRPNHIPRYASTPDGFWCDPVNVAVVGTYDDLVDAMALAGWQQADRKTVSSMLRVFKSFFLKRPYPNAPFSTLYLFGRGQDIGFEKPIKGSVTQRHHVRFWACRNDVHPHFAEHVAFWNRHYLAAHQANRYLWVGAATKDIGLALIRYNLQLTHAIDSDTNAERDFVIKSLHKAGVLNSISVVKASQAHTRKNRGIGITMEVDGELHIALLKPQKAKH